MDAESLKTEQTGQQLISYLYSGLLQRDYSRIGTYTQLRATRKDPTVSLARGLLISGMQAGSWSIEAEDDKLAEGLEHLIKFREDLLYTIIAFAKVDFGWQGFEKVFKLRDNRLEIDFFKPLLQDITTILITPKGKFAGYRQSAITGLPVDLPSEKCLHIAFGVEAGNLYGMPLLEDIRQAGDMWDECNSGARRYDKKLAGSHWLIKYPPGESTIDGVSVPNGELAATLLAALESSGSVAVPNTVADVVQELNTTEVTKLYSWHVELLSDNNPRQESFTKRLTYLDKLKVRGLLMPERSILEGQYGTKAEAGEHGNFAIVNIEAADRQIARMINNQVVDQLLRLNYGESYVGKARIVAAPLIDKQISFLREIYKGISDPDIDLDRMKSLLDVPVKEGGSDE